MEFKNIIQQVKNEYNIVDYIRASGVDLESSGNGQWKGLCPFHNERTASFVVSEDFQSYKCFGCLVQGDILSYAEHTHTVSFFEALKMLAEEKDIKISESISKEASHNITEIRNIVADARDFFRKNYDKLDGTHPAKKEVIKRGLNPSNELFGFSLEAPNELYKHLKNKGYSDENIKDSNLVIFFKDNRPPWDFFHGRLMITLSDYLGRPISFTSRKIYEDDKMAGKYVNGKESPVFHKKSNLFGADIAKAQARKSKEIYVVEGQFDQISMVENGIENVVATSGTAFTNEHANLLLRMVGNTGKVIFIMDGDSAGIEAAIKVFMTSRELHSNAHAVLLEEGKDPCDYIEAGGIEAIRQAISEAVPLHDFVIDSVINQLGGSINVNNRHKFVSEVTKYAKNTEENFIIDSMLNKASIISAISINNVREIYEKAPINKSYNTKEKAPSKTLNPNIVLNMKNEADVCMFSAIALLVRLPDKLIDLTPDLIHKKFRSFIKELKERYTEITQGNEPWRFIPEDYTDSDFAILLQNKEFLENPKEDIKSAISQYEYLFDRANILYKQDYDNFNRVKALSSVIDSTNAKEIAEALKLYTELKS